MILFSGSTCVSNIHLLLVEDNPDYLELLTEELEDFGYQHIDSAKDVTEAREKLDQKLFDITISDMRLGGNSSGGFSALDEAHKRNTTSIKIILTANDTVEDCRRAFKRGVWDYISKNMRGDVFSELHNSIQQAITHYQFNLERSISNLIKLGESETLEFKSTLQWDVRNKQVNPDLRFEVLKAVDAFLNSKGGTLLIGVEDDGTVFGLKRDLSLLGKRQTLDGFEQKLIRSISDHIGKVFTSFIKVRFEEIDDKQVCIVDVNRASEPAFMTDTSGKKFYIRAGCTSHPLDIEETARYIRMNWK